jgi:hypothetical protein
MIFGRSTPRQSVTMKCSRPSIEKYFMNRCKSKTVSIRLTGINLLPSAALILMD